MNSHKARLLLCVSLIWIGACSKTTELNADHSVLVRVNGHDISVHEFNQLYTKRRGEAEAPGTRSPKVREATRMRALNEIIVMSVVREEAVKREIRIAREEVEARLANWKDGYPPGGFEEMLRKQNTTEEYIKRRIEDQLLIEKITDSLFRTETLVSDEEMKNYFKNHEKDFFLPERVHAFQILVPTVAEAEKIRQEIASNQMTFESAARKYSISPDSAKGGDVGFFTKNEKISAFNEAFKLQTNEISKPVQSKFGAHLLKVVEKQPAQKQGFDAAKSEIAKTMRHLKEVKVYKEWVTKLLRDGEIYRNDTLFAALE